MCASMRPIRRDHQPGRAAEDARDAAEREAGKIIALPRKGAAFRTTALEQAAEAAKATETTEAATAAAGRGAAGGPSRSGRSGREALMTAMKQIYPMDEHPENEPENEPGKGE